VTEHAPSLPTHWDLEVSLSLGSGRRDLRPPSRPTISAPAKPTRVGGRPDISGKLSGTIVSVPRESYLAVSRVKRASSLTAAFGSESRHSCLQAGTTEKCRFRTLRTGRLTSSNVRSATVEARCPPVAGIFVALVGGTLYSGDQMKRVAEPGLRIGASMQSG
jgi:hypothetical protein